MQDGLTILGRGCVKTLFAAYFRGRRTITQAPIVDPGASNELDNFRGPSIFVLSHSLGRERTLPVTELELTVAAT